MKDIQTMTDLQNVHQVINRAAQKWGDKTAIIFDETEETFSFNEVKDHAEDLAALFIELGIEKQDKVALMLPNVSAFPLSWLALGLIGAVAVPLNYRYQSFDATYLLKHSESKVVLSTSEKVDMLNTIRKKNDFQFKIITTDKKNTTADGFLNELLKTK